MFKLFLFDLAIDQIKYPASTETPFKNSLSVKFNGNKHWVLTEPLEYDDGETQVTVPVGFRTDLASIPRFAWAYLSPWDIARAAVIHDYLYWQLGDNYTKAERKHADDVFLNGMRHCVPAISKIKAKAAYRAVRIFGGLFIKYRRTLFK